MAFGMTVLHHQEGEFTSTPDSSPERTHVSEAHRGCRVRIDWHILRSSGHTMTKQEYDAWHLEEYGR